MKHFSVISTLIVVYLIFAILLNSVGVVILQSIGYFEVNKIEASVLEGFKDLPIAVISFLIASQLPRIGYRRGMLAGLLIVMVGCLAMIFGDAFWATKLHFLCIGVAFGITKVAIYSSVGLITESKEQHASLLNMIEGFFVLGVLSGYWIFGAFIDSNDPTNPSWLNVYWLLIAACAVAILLVWRMKLDESAASDGNEQSIARAYGEMLKLAARPLIIVFVFSLFLYVVIEQGIGTWLPTFNKEVLHLPAQMSVQAASIFAGALAAGRLLAGVVLQRLRWFPFLCICLVGMAALIILTLPLTRDLPTIASVTWLSAPLVVYLFPLIGFFMGPIYPVVSSVVLSSMPKPEHAPATGLLVVFSALGGTLGSLITGRAFEAFDGQSAFYLILVPICIVFVTLFILNRLTSRNETEAITG